MSDQWTAVIVFTQDGDTMYEPSSVSVYKDAALTSNKEAESIKVKKAKKNTDTKENEGMNSDDRPDDVKPKGDEGQFNITVSSTGSGCMWIGGRLYCW